MFAWLRRKPKVPVSRLAPGEIQSALSTAQRALAAGDPRRVFDALKPLLEDTVVHPEACHVAALAACASGDFPRAAALLETATQADPSRIASWHTLGEVRLELRDGAAAVDAFRALLAQDPAYRAAHDRLLTALAMAGRHDEALVTYQMHRALDWTFDVLANPAAALHAQGRLDEAVDLLRKRISLERGNARLWTYLGRTRHAQGHLDTAIACFREAVKADPDYPQARRGLAFALDSSGEVSDAIEHYRAVTDQLPGDAQSYSDYLAAQLYVGWPSLQAARAAYEEYDRRFGRDLASRTTEAAPRNDGRPIRIGYVSGDFGEHAITYFFEPLLEHHDRTRFEVWCYDRTPQQDAAGVRLAGKADRWQRVHGMQWDELAQVVRRDGIDVLVDLKGHFDDNHLPLFARKPAPVQVTWLGYPDTTGMPSIDAWFTDEVIASDLHDQYAAETVVPLGPFFMCFRPKPDAPAPSAPPAVSRGHVTFGCFNSYAKISPEMRAAIADILVALPDARCVFTAVPRGNARERLLESLEQRGVDRGRVEIRGRGGHDEFLRWHEEVDITLDSFPYNGTTTALHSLWMGVPFIALAGTTHVSRVGASILVNLGLGDWVAADRDAYVALAVAKAKDVDALVALRTTLRERLRNSPVMDEPAFVRRFESACESLLRKCLQRTGS